jgi:sugar lactone lactonase YvrE
MKRFFALPIAILILAELLVLAEYVSAQGSLEVGYSVYSADSGSSAPVGAALFRVTDSTGNVVSEAGVGAAAPVANGRVFVDETGTKMGLALVNANPNAASITFTLRDANGVELARQNQSLGANQHLASYVDDLFPTQAAGLQGSLTFMSSQPLAAVTLRENRNSQNEPLYTTLPVVDLLAEPSSKSVIFPHIAAGGGFTTELLLMNPTTSVMTGNVQFYGDDGQPLSLENGDQMTSQLPYTIAANGTFQAMLTSAAPVSGWAMAVPLAGSWAPSGSIIFQLKANGDVVTEAGVGATPALSAVRIFVDNAQTQTGVAIANPSGSTANLTLTLMDQDGTVEDTQTRTLAPGSHMAVYVNDLFSTVTNGFTGLLDIRSDVNVASITLKLTVNAQDNLVMTTLPVADLTNPPASTMLIFPQIVIGGGFSTRLILINTNSSMTASGKLSFYQSNGTNMVVPLGSQSGGQFPYQLAAAGGRQFYPGNAATVASISVIDPSNGQATAEVIINQGNTVRPRLRITDSTGAFRDDFSVTIQSLDTAVATVDSSGSIKGQTAGFSTLTLTSQNVVTTAVATVVTVNSGVAGYQVKGITQDLANRLYLAASSDQAILLAQDVAQSPATYAGTPGKPGLKNGARLQSQFNNPSFLAFDQSLGTLYVSDAANNVIRRVYPGTPGKVDTLAGTGTAGAQDGPLPQATFNNPQGIALDRVGRLWIADSGNHTIRRIDLLAGIVETIAGMPGRAGLADGQGQAARFRNPLGLAVENQSAALELQGEILGQPPPPVRVVVADSGNNAVRRVSEDGQVETLGSTNGGNTLITPSKAFLIRDAGAAPLTFTAPTAIAVDSFDDIFVTESSTGQVKTILNTGSVVAAAQRSTFTAPSGITITRQGSVVVADAKFSAQQIVYGAPGIAGVNPSSVRATGGDRVTMSGRNFSPESAVFVFGFVISDVRVVNSQTITFTMPAAESGLATVTVQNRGGLAQAALSIVPVPLSSLPIGYITTYGGGSTYIGDGGSAKLAATALPSSVALDSAGNLYIADAQHERVRKVAAGTGVITTVAGTGIYGSSGDNGPAAAAQLSVPLAIAVDRNGNLFIAEQYANRIRKVNTSSGVITTFAGNGSAMFSGDGGPAALAALNQPQGVAADFNGNVFIYDACNSRIRKVDGQTGIITTVAGSGQPGFSGDGGPAILAQIGRTCSPFNGNVIGGGVALDSNGNLFIADFSNNRIRKVDVITGSISTVAGNGNYASTGDNGPATLAGLAAPNAVVFDPMGNMLIAERGGGLAEVGSRIRQVSFATQTISTIAGNGTVDYSGDAGSPAAASLAEPLGLTVDGAGTLYIADTYNNRIRKVAGNVITTFAGNGQSVLTGDGGPATAATLCLEYGLDGSVVIDSSSSLYISDYCTNTIRRIDRTGIIGAIAGGRNVQTGPFTIDSSGNVFIAGIFDQIVQRIDAVSGTVTTVAGNGQFGNSGDYGPATSATLTFPGGIAVDSSGNLYISQTKAGSNGNDSIRKVDAQTGIITTVVQQAIIGGLVADRQGNVFFFAFSSATDFSAPFGIYEIDPYGGINLILPGWQANCLASDDKGNIWFCASGVKVARFSVGTGSVLVLPSSIDRTGAPSGDGGPVASANLNPFGVAVDSEGNIFVLDNSSEQSRIRAIRGPFP